MPLITLTTDFGEGSVYTAQLKGILHQRIPTAVVSDVAHNIPSYNIPASAFAIQSAAANYPANTAHIGLVNLYSSEQPRMLLTQHEKQIFIVPDNGLLPLIVPGVKLQVYALKTNGHSLTTLFTAVADTLKLTFAKKPIEAKAVNDYMRSKLPEAILSNSSIKAQVLYIDAFGNIVWNLKAETFETFRQGRRYEIGFRGGRIQQLSNNYASVSDGETAAFFNSMGLLELAINHGNAARLLGIDRSATLMITFMQ